MQQMKKPPLQHCSCMMVSISFDHRHRLMQNFLLKGAIYFMYVSLTIDMVHMLI